MDLTLSIKDNLLLDDRLKPQEVYLFMHLVRLCDRKTGELNISALELMEQTRFTNKSLMLGYIKKLIECNVSTRPLHVVERYYVKRYAMLDQKRLVDEIDTPISIK